MFGLMRNFYVWAKKKRERCITICLLGLDNAGKTTTLHRIKGEIPDMITPTWGFSSEELQHGRYKLNMYDLGGGKNIRGIWDNYYAEAHGVIYVIDSAAIDRIEDAREVLMKAMTEPRLSGKPLLILANKQDLPDALKADEMAKTLRLEELTNVSYRIMGCSALKETDNLHLGVIQGLQWLTSIISSRYEQLCDRVVREVEEQKEREKRLQEEKRLRVEALREERRKKREAEEAAAAAAAVSNTTATPDGESTTTAGAPPDTAAQKLIAKDEALQRVASSHTNDVNPSVDISVSIKDSFHQKRDEPPTSNPVSSNRAADEDNKAEENINSSHFADTNIGPVKDPHRPRGLAPLHMPHQPDQDAAAPAELRTKLPPITNNSHTTVAPHPDFQLPNTITSPGSKMIPLPPEDDD